MICHRRARREEDKQARQDAILAAAERLFDRQDYASLRMDDIAREAGLAKGTLYLYFATKEEVFLALESRAIGAWLDRLAAQLPGLPASLSPDAFAALFSELLAAEPRLLALLALLHSVLERNVSAAAALRFKLALAERFERLGPPLATRLGLPASEGRALLLRLYAVLIGIWQVAMPAPVVRAVLAADPRLAGFQLDFRSELTATVAALLRGWQATPASLQEHHE